MRARGSATAEYVGVILTVGLMMLALVALREHRPERRPPIDPVARIGGLVRPIPVPRVRPAARPRAATPARPRAPRRPSPPRTAVLVPGWAVGW